VQLQKVSAEQAISRGLDIAKRPPKEVHDGWYSSAGRRVFVYLPPLVSRRKAYILNQGPIYSVTFLFRGRYPGQGLGTQASDDTKRRSPCRLCGFWMLNKKVGAMLLV
jgi:hypothetical protein